MDSPPLTQTRFAALRMHTRQFVRRIRWISFSLGTAVSVILGASYLALHGSSSNAAAATSTVAVSRQTLVASVKAVGKVTFASEQELRFNQKGTVAKVNVKEGDMVKAGQVLAELDKSSVLADVRTAQLSVGASALQLQQLQGDKAKTLLDAQNAVNETQRQYEQAQTDLSLSQQKLPTTLAQAKNDVQQKQAALTQAQTDLEKTKKTEIQSIGSTAQTVLSTTDQLLDSFYSVLTRNAASRPAAGNYSIEIDHFLYNDPVLKQQVEFAYYDAVNDVNDMRTRYPTSLSSQGDPAVLLQALSDAHKTAQAVSDLAEKTYQLLQGATTDTSKFTPTQLDSLRSTVSGNRTKATSLVTDTDSAQADLLAATQKNGGIPSLTLQQKQDAVISAQNALTEAQSNLKLLQTQNPADLAAQQDSLEKLQEDLQSKQAALTSTAKSTDVNIQLKQNDIAQKAASLQKTQKTLTDYQLTAPFDGVVKRLDYKVGDNLLDTSTDEYVTLENPDFLIVTIPLDQTDVVRVKAGQPSTVSFDALPGQSFQGAIDSIDPTAIEQSGVVSYNVSVKLPTPKDLTILSGMTATVTIETSRKDNVVAVPNLALRHQGQRTMVQLASGQQVPVETGMSDGQYTEVTSGVQEGQTIVAMNVVVSGTTSTNANAAQQLLRGAGGGAGFGGNATFIGGGAAAAGAGGARIRGN